VFGVVERGSSRTFLFPVPDITTDTLRAIIYAWIEPGTTVISECWDAYRHIDSQGFTRRTVNHSIHFVDADNRDHTNTIKSTWRSFKVFLGQYSRGEDSQYYLAYYMFAARCNAQGVAFLQFLPLIANKDWSLCDVPRSSTRAR
jgi:hypothetical protein